MVVDDLMLIFLGLPLLGEAAGFVLFERTYACCGELSPRNAVLRQIFPEILVNIAALQVALEQVVPFALTSSPFAAT